MSPTVRQQTRERDSSNVYRLAKWNALFAGSALAVSIFGAYWQVHSARQQRKSYDSQLGAIKASVRILTATVAPQLLKAVDDSLASALATDDPSVASQKLNTAETDAQQLRSLGAKLPSSQVSATAKILGSVVAKHPELPEGWRAVATLAEYRTSDLIEQSKTLPDCDVSQSPRGIDEIEVRDMPDPHRSLGYLWRNCTLHMDHLPSGKIHEFTAKQPAISPDPLPFESGLDAYAVNCNIVLTDSGIAESGILFFTVFNSRFQYQVERTPSVTTRRFLLASLQSPIAGRFSLDLTKEPKPQAD